MVMAMKVDDVMSKEVHLAEVPGTRHDLLKIFNKYKVSGFPVVRKDSKELVGLVTSKDLFRRSKETQIAMIMNKNPITCKPGTDLKKAVALMVENHIHRLIVEKDKKVVGMVTPHDVLPIVMKSQIETPVVNLVKRRCVPVYDETPLFLAWRILKISQSYALPVLDKKGFLVGLVTDRDFFMAGREGHKVKTETLGVGEDEDMWTWESLKPMMKVYYEVSDMDMPGKPVKEYMRKDPTTVFINTPAFKAAEKMYKNDYRVLPIIDNAENLVNMVSDLDIISTLM
jgi:CBS domain-containing protein